GFPDVSADEWRMPSTQAMGGVFLFGPGRDARGLLMWGRAMIGLLGVMLGLLVFLTTQRLLGMAPALVSLGVFSFCPSMLAQGALVTSDMAVTLFFTLSVLCVWRVLHVVNWRTIVVGAIVIGCLLLSKLS